MAKLNTYSVKGTKKGTSTMPKGWQEDVNKNLLAQAIRVYENKRHPGLSKTKTRGEIRASTRKIYRQKGLGLARHGAVSAPIFVGGSKAHGPKGAKRELKLPKKMRKKAFSMALTYKADKGELLVVEGIGKLKKTKDAGTLIGKIAKKEKEIGAESKFTFALSEKNKDSSLYLRNLENVEIVNFKNLNAHNVFFAGILVIDKDALKKTKSGKVKKKSKKTKSKKSAKTKSKTKTKKKKKKAKKNSKKK